MAASTLHLPVDVYLQSSFEPDAEYVDGEIQERAVGELEHAAWQRAIQKWFFLRELEWGVRVFVELRVQVSSSRFRVPDVVVLENTGDLRAMDQIVHTPPVAVFEILSPEDTHARLMQKLSDYEGMGIKSIFVIEPDLDLTQCKKYQFESGSLKRADAVAISIQGQTHSFQLSEFEQFFN